MHKCSICGKPAPYQIKGTTTYYCQECAEELFGDVSYLVKADLANAQKGADAIKDMLPSDDELSESGGDEDPQKDV